MPMLGTLSVHSQSRQAARKIDRTSVMHRLTVLGLVAFSLTHLHSRFKKLFINRQVADQTNGEWHYMLVVEGRKVS